MSSDFTKSIEANAILLPLNKEYDEVVGRFRKAYGKEDIGVTAIYKIRNRGLEEAFVKRQESITGVRKVRPEVVEVYHGTSMVAAAGIVNMGFDPSRSQIAVYGKGTYASPNAYYTQRYCKDVKGKQDYSMIFLCRFLKGTHGITPSDTPIDTTRMDYCGADSILVTPYADGIIPDYLLFYYSWQ
jgi:hypothetical protein